MINVKMKGYKVSEISFVNKHENGFKTELDKKISYMVKYNGTNICIGEFTAEMFDKNAPEKFRIKVILNGMFEYEPSIIKEKIHIETFKELFPYVRSVISSVTVNAGLPPMIIPAVDIESETICRYDPGNLKGE